MTVLVVIGLLLLVGVLVLVTLVQILYMESQRLLTRELPAQQFFRETLEEKIGLEGELGALAFSITKHTTLTALAILIFSIAIDGEGLRRSAVIEGLLLTWMTMTVFTYIVPQFLYRRTSGKWLMGLLPVIRGFAVLARPITGMLSFLQSLAELSQPQEQSAAPVTEEESVEALITAGKEEGILEEDDRKLIHSVVAFGNKTVREVMTPRPNIVSIAADATLENLRALVIHEQYSRIPVYETSIDQIIGFVHVRDMFEVDQTERARRTVREILRPVRFVPETKAVNDLLKDMQQTGAHMAIVVDEYGNTAGLVTMEDLVEEIVGEIRDEHEPQLDVQQDATGGYIVSGSFDLDHLEELLEFRADQDTESTTVGGLITEWLGRVPKVGEAVERDGIRIEVLAGNELRVEQVRISKVAPAHAQADPYV